MQQRPPPTPGERRSEKNKTKQQKYRNSYRSDDGTFSGPAPTRGHAHRRTLTAAEVHTPRRKPGKLIFLADIVPGLGQSDVSEASYLLTRHLFRATTVAPCFRGFARLTFVCGHICPPSPPKKTKNTHTCAPSETKDDKILHRLAWGVARARDGSRRTTRGGKRSDEEVNQGAASQEYTHKNLALPVTNSKSLTQLGFS